MTVSSRATSNRVEQNRVQRRSNDMSSGLHLQPATIHEESEERVDLIMEREPVQTLAQAAEPRYEYPESPERTPSPEPLPQEESTSPRSVSARRPRPA